MKKMINSTIIILILLGLNISLNAQSDNTNPIALIQKVIQDVKYKPIQKDWLNAKAGLALKDGEEVKTGNKSLALVKFLDGSLVRVRENTTLSIYAKTENKKQSNNAVISNGQINFDVRKQGNSDFTFTTPTGIASIRGTSGLIEVLDPNQSKFILETGSLDLQATSGNKMNSTLTAGNTAIITDDGNIIISETNEDDKSKIKNSKSTEVKKLVIKTQEGYLEIEYYESN